MKILHCADIHLGSKMEARLPKEKSDERKVELRASFNRMIERAKAEGVRLVLLSGDVFDSERPLKRDKEFFYSVVGNNPEIDFLYLRGNHDGKESYVEYGLANLKTFGGEWTKYSYGELDVYGIEMDAGNAQSLYSTLKTDAGRKNIVMLHGQAGDGSGKDKVNLTKLRNRAIDYLALGHIHAYECQKLDDRGIWAYSGCLEGRGFDEPGEKGFVLLDTDGEWKAEFVPNATRVIEEIQVDVTGTADFYGAFQKCRQSIKCKKTDLLRINLVGEIDYDNATLAVDMRKNFENDYYFVSVKDKTVRRFDMEKIAADPSLRGEFIRTVLARTDLDEQFKQKVVDAGLKALSGREVD